MKTLLGLFLVISSAASHATVTHRQTIQNLDGSLTVNVTPDSALEVDVQDRETPQISMHLMTNGPLIGFSATQTVGDRFAHMDPSHGLVADTYVQIFEGDRWGEYEVLAVNIGGDADSVEFDTEMDFAWTEAAIVSPGSSNLAQDGSAIGGIVAFFGPGHLQDDIEMHISRIIINILDDSAMDDGIFAGGDSLRVGLVLRLFRNGEYFTLFNIKTNGDLKAIAYDVIYATKPPAGTFHGLTFRRTWGGAEKTGGVLALSSTTNDRLELLIQDDCSGVVQIQVVVQGHQEE